jgi:pyruvate, water dikinase
MPVDDFYWLDQILPSHRTWVGDKAFYLGLLAQQGHPIAPGLVISARTLQEFLAKIKWIEPLFADLPDSSLRLDVDNSRQLQAIAQKIRQAIQSTPLPDDWLTEVEVATQGWQSLILRPSFALPSQLDPTVSARTTGLLESQVCWNQREAIAQGIKQVWSELFRAKSLLYWQRLGIQVQQVHLAVLVQPMGSAIASGDIYPADHATEIRAVWGLGKALVTGEVTPDRYEIQPNGQTHHPACKDYAYYALAESERQLQKERLDPAQQNQSPIDFEQIQSIVDLAHQATSDLGMPLRVEWTLVRSAETNQPTLHLTQAIPQLTGRHPALSHLTGLAAAPGQVTAEAWVVATDPLPDDVPSGVVLVAQSLTPDLLLRLKQIVGIVTEQGGMTSHAAIVAREMGIPAVLGIAGATQQIRSGEGLRVDGDRGEVHRVTLPIPAPDSLPRAGMMIRHSHPKSPNRTQLMVTLSQPESIAAAQLPVDGVGLLRSELMLLEALDRQHPKLWVEQGRQPQLVERIAQKIRAFAEAFNPRPVFYRSLDLRSHEFPSLEGANVEQYPMLGIRGTLSYQVTPAQFEVELLALRQVQQWGYGNVHLLLPFVRTVEEFIFCRQQVERMGLMQNPQFQLWIMAEVPSVLLLLPDYVAAGVQGIAIGSNDLTQLLLGVDREHPDMAIAFNQHHPVVLRAIQHLITGAHQAGIPCTLCGQAPSQYPDLVESLVAWGITAISVDAADVDWVHRAIARAEQR